MATQDDINSFHQFASDQIRNGGQHKTVDEWRFGAGHDRINQGDLAAIRESVYDWKRGERGRDMDEVITELEASLDQSL